MWTSTDVLYAMFILKANHRSWKSFVKNLSGRDEDFCMFAMMIYADLFADRGVVEEEYDAYVSDDFKARGLDKKLHPFQCWQIHMDTTIIHQVKIKFRFVDEE